jgi:hypothetical protein
MEITMREKLILAALSIVLLSSPKTAAAQCSTFGGRATVVQANGLGILPVALADTGNINSTGGTNQASLLNVSVPGLLLGDVLHATAIGGGSASQSEASIANVNLTVAGNTISAGFVMSRANAFCGSARTINGITEVDGLVVNGQSVGVTGFANQTVSLPGGAWIIINEQTGSSSSGSIQVNALHVTVPGVADVVTASSSAAVSVQFIGASGGPHLFVGMLLQVTGNTFHGPGCDFVTGGGWINADPDTNGPIIKGTFAVAGGISSNFDGWGHLEYQDHGTGMKVHGTGVTSYGPAPLPPLSSNPNAKEIKGTANVDGQSGYSYTVDVADNGEPGIGTDFFQITIYPTGNPIAVIYAAAGTLQGGNIQLHNRCF